MKKTFLNLPCLFVLCPTFTVGVAHADLLAYEGFETISDDGVNLPSLDRTDSSDFGWGDQWRWNANTGLGITVNRPGLAFGNLDTVGKLATSNFNDSSAGMYRRQMETSYTVGTGAGERGEMWASWLTTWSGNGDGTGGNGLQWFKLHNDGSEVISAGINNWGGVRTTQLEDQWRLAPGVFADPLDSFTGVVAEPGETYLLAMRLSAAGDDTLIELFVNSAGDRELGAPLATHTLSGAATFNQVRLQTQQTNITAEWDEIRIGDSAGDVGFGGNPGQTRPVISKVNLDQEISSVSLTWNSEAGAFYTLYGSPDLSEGNWVEVDGAIPAGSQDETTYEFSATPGSSSRFYRILKNQ